MFCQKCGKEIADDAQFCQFCGQKFNQNIENKKGNSGSKAVGCLVIGLILIFLILVVPFIIGANSDDNYSTTSNSSCPPSQELEDAITQYREGHIISGIVPQLNTVYITNAAQNQLSPSDIETLGYLTACYSAYKKGNNLVWVDIYNTQTRKKIAEYSQSYGFKMK